MGSTIEEYLKYDDQIENKYGINSVVLMMVGSFYEMYTVIPDSNEIEKKVSMVSKILNIKLTHKKSLENIYANAHMCGFPCHALGKHLSKLLSSNFTVAIYDQFDPENPNNKKIHKLVNVYSPSTYIEDEVIENNELMCVLIEDYFCPIQKKRSLSGFISSIDLSTGRNRLFECYDNKDTPNFVLTEVIRLIHTINPCEIVICDYNNHLDLDDLGNKLIHPIQIDDKFKNKEFQEKFLEKVFGKPEIISVIEEINLDKNGDLLTCYIQLLQFAYEHDPNIIKKIYKPIFMEIGNELLLNNDAIFQLNLLHSNPQQNIKTHFSSLFEVINRTSTRMGKRLLKERIMRPITDTKLLNERYNEIEMMIPKYLEYKNILKYIMDIEKKYRKWVLNKLHPYEFAQLDNSFDNIIKLLIKGKKNFKIKSSLIAQFQDFYNNYNNSFILDEMEKYNLTNIKTSFIKVGIDKEIDKRFKKIQNIQSILKKICVALSRLIDTTRDDLIKVGDTEKEGYYLTTTRKRWNQINKLEKIKINFNNQQLEINLSDFTSKNLSNSVKISSELIEKYSNILIRLDNNMKILVKKTYFQKLNEYQEKYGDTIQSIIRYISKIDVITSSAEVAVKYSYSKPSIQKREKSFISTKEIRHPIIERIQDNVEYITNDIELGTEQNGMLLYGLNSSGKSSLLRAVGCNIILAQIGMYVSAKEFKFCPFNRLMTKISTLDNLFKGQSTFIVEMQELKEILNKGNEKSLVLCDELTAGTETNSATGIVASAIINLIKKKSNFVFTTHLHSLMEFDKIRNEKKLGIFNFRVEIEGSNIIYKRKLEKGSGKDMYGIEIAKALGLDKEFIKDAFSFRNEYQKDLVTNKRSRYNRKVIVDECSICGKKDMLHTHHIQPQKLSDKNGIIKHFPKNIKHNLQIVCEGCHIKIHNE